jgi:hypothetical protein
MNSRDKLMTARFTLNMERIHGLVKLIYSDIASLRPTGAFKSEGPRADILRAIVVFLHATFEDVLRSWEAVLVEKTDTTSEARMLADD